MTKLKQTLQSAITSFEKVAAKYQDYTPTKFAVVDVLGALDDLEGSPLRFLEAMASNRYAKQMSDFQSIVDEVVKRAGAEKKKKAKGAKEIEAAAKKLGKVATTVDNDVQSLNRKYSTAKYESVTLVDWPLVEKGTKFDNLDLAGVRAYHFEFSIVADKRLLDQEKKGVEGIELAKLVQAACNAVSPFRSDAQVELVKLDQQLAGGLTRSEQIRKCQDATKKLNGYIKAADTAAVKAVNALRKKAEGQIKTAKGLKFENIRNVVCGTISASAGVIQAIASLGTNVLAYVQITQALIRIGGSLYEMYQSADDYAEEIADHGRTMIARMTKAESTLGKKYTAEEFASIAGIPLLTTSKAMRVAVRSLDARLPKMDKQCRSFLQKTNELMTSLKSIKDVDQSAALGKKCTKLLNEIGEIQKGKANYEKTIETGLSIMANYDAKKWLTVKKFDKFYGVQDRVDNAKTTAQSILTIAKAIAV